MGLAVQREVRMSREGYALVVVEVTDGEVTHARRIPQTRSAEARTWVYERHGRTLYEVPRAQTDGPVRWCRPDLLAFAAERSGRVVTRWENRPRRGAA